MSETTLNYKSNNMHGLENQQIIENMNNFLNNDNLPVILKHLGYLIVFMFSVTGLSIKASLIFAALMVVDVITGIIRAYVVNGKNSITSKTFSTGILSKLLLVTVPVVLALAGIAVGMETYIIAQTALQVFILSEAYSIIGNIHSIKTKSVKREFDAVAWVLGKINKTLEKFTLTKTNNK